MIREAQRVISSGYAKLLLLGDPDQFGAAVPDGMAVVPISCQSEGALEVYIEPVLPVPHLVVVGRSPMAQMLADLARALGWRTDLIDGPDFTCGDAVSSRMVVVATQGHNDEGVLERAVAARPAYLGLVGSRSAAPPCSVISPSAACRRPPRARPGASRARSGQHDASGDCCRDPR